MNINFPSPIPIASYSHFGCTWGLRAAAIAVQGTLACTCVIMLVCVCVCGWVHAVLFDQKPRKLTGPGRMAGQLGGL